VKLAARDTIVAAGLAILVFAAAPLAQDSQQRRGFSIAITTPVNQEVVFGKTKISADITIDDPTLVEKVEFIIGEETVFVDREPPYECFHDFGEESASFIVRAVAHHVEGVSVSDAVITRKMKWATIERVNRALLWVSATNKRGDYITDLTKEELQVFEDDKPQRVIDFYAENRPITMAILIDTSGSMRDKIGEVHLAAGSFVETLRDIDRALVIDFDDNVFLIQDLTSDHAALKTAIESTEPLGATSIYDALHAAYRKIGTIDGRKAIILLSDGEDTTSQFGFKRVLEEAKTNNTLIYSIAVGASSGGGRKNVLKEFSDVTGGRFFSVKKAEDLAGVYQRIAEELRKQFYLTYSTDNDEWNGRWIKLRVVADREDVKIRSRRGYFAVRGSSVGKSAG
jgi:Ca-activated chloride channel family protein